ncbi:MAG: hypothetical protein JWP37_4118 [Mucilaginibacter sp.]|nr:hypothetical protein [Mucilaginibacter sp.]
MINKVLFYIAAVGWLCALYINLYALQGVDLSAKYYTVWLLHAGVFFVWIPAVLELRKNEEWKQLRSNSRSNAIRPFGFYRILLKGVPAWLTMLFYGCLIYTFCSFIYFNFNLSGFINTRHQVSEITARQKDVNTISLFSAVWLFFYCTAATILYPYKDIPLDGNTDNYNFDKK